MYLPDRFSQFKPIYFITWEVCIYSVEYIILKHSIIIVTTWMSFPCKAVVLSFLFFFLQGFPVDVYIILMWDNQYFKDAYFRRAVTIYEYGDKHQIFERSYLEITHVFKDILTTEINSCD